MLTQPHRHTILIVDDTPINIEILSMILANDYNVIAATSGAEALAVTMATPPPDLILLDVMMPKESGYDICEKIKANPDRCDIPIIFVTVMSDIDSEEIGFAVGAADYITKPVSPPLVLARVKTHLALHGYAKQLKNVSESRNNALCED